MLSKEWIGGFISGEGCFTFNASIPHFQLGLHIKDLKILEEIKESIGIGRINKRKMCRVLVVSRLQPCLKLVEFLDGNIKGDKLIDYENWKIGLEFLQSIPNNERLSEEDNQFINTLKPTQNKNRIIYKEYPQHIMW